MQSSHERLVADVHGHVQGVGFRAYVYDVAQALGIPGSVQNCRDGSVRVEAEGPRDLLDRLVLALRAGPPAARVERVTEAWSEARGVKRFTILPM
jgi:acylphosphatase